MTFPIDTNIPAANNDPADDQPLMQQNFSNISQYLTVDHVAPGSSGAGQHEQVTYNSQNTPSSPTDPVAITYTGLGTASVVSQLFYRNQNATYHLSAIKSWGSFDPNSVSLAQTYNVASIVRNSAGNYTVTMNSGTTSSPAYAILISIPMTSAFSTGGICGYEITGVNTFKIYIRSLTGNSGVDLAPVSFQVMQI